MFRPKLLMTFLSLSLACSTVAVAETQVSEGDQAPDFKLLDQDGNAHELSDYEGKWLVLYFYPKDDTPAARPKPASFVTIFLLSND